MNISELWQKVGDRYRLDIEGIIVEVRPGTAEEAPWVALLPGSTTLYHCDTVEEAKAWAQSLLFSQLEDAKDDIASWLDFLRDITPVPTGKVVMLSELPSHLRERIGDDWPSDCAVKVVRCGWVFMPEYQAPQWDWYIERCGTDYSMEFTYGRPS